MERRKFLGRAGVGAVIATLFSGKLFASNRSSEALQKEEVQHMVIFDLKYAKNSKEVEIFLNDGKRILSAIPVVQNFQAFKQVSPKNDYSYGFSMVFKDEKAYKTYNDHTDHVDFVENRWMKEVTRFLEIDFEKA
jgi:hypothetical protein